MNLPPFVTVLSSGATPTDDPLTLTREQRHAVDAALDDIDRCRAAAWVSAQSYVICGSEST